MFLVESRQTTFYNHVLKVHVYINFQCKKKTLNKLIKISDIIPLKGDLFRCNLNDTCYCNCDNYVENNELLTL